MEHPGDKNMHLVDFNEALLIFCWATYLNWEYPAGELRALRFYCGFIIFS